MFRHAIAIFCPYLSGASVAEEDGVVRVKSACAMGETIARRHGIAGEAARPFSTATGVIASIASSMQAR